jgi:hypothetical protein
MVSMGGFNFKDLSVEQEKILRDILEVCSYFSSARHNNVADDTLAGQAKEIGFKFQQLQATKNELNER